MNWAAGRGWVATHQALERLGRHGCFRSGLQGQPRLTGLSLAQRLPGAYLPEARPQAPTQRAFSTRDLSGGG